MIFSSKPSKWVWCFLTSCGWKLPLRSRGTSIGISPDSVLSVLSLVPFRELPEPWPAGSCFSYPRCSVISADSAFPTSAAVSCFRSPSGPSRSSGFLYPSKSSFRTSSRIAMVPRPFRQDPSSSSSTYTKVRTGSGINYMAVHRVWRRHGLQPHRIEMFKVSKDPVGAQWELLRALARTDQSVGHYDASLRAHVNRRCPRVTALLGCFSNEYRQHPLRTRR